MEGSRYLKLTSLLAVCMFITFLYWSGAKTKLLSVPGLRYGKQEMTSEIIDRCSTEQAIKHFALTKVEKTGSTTLHTILARFVVKAQLSILMATNSYHVNWRVEGSTKKGWDIYPEGVERAEVLIDHAEYNKSMLDKYIVPGYQNIAIVRDPESWIQSAAEYFAKHSQINKLLQYHNFSSHTRAEAIIQNDELLYVKRMGNGPNSYFHLPQLQWYGFDYNRRDNMTAIKEFIRGLTPRINIIVLTDQFEASLLILRKRFCWSHEDIIYRKYVKSKSTKVPLSAKAKEKLQSPEVNLGDQLLYEELNTSWWNQSETREDDFWEEE